MAPRNPERTRARLLQAALKEFASHGYAGARVARIARNARANQRMVYHYFGSKEGLYEATYMRMDAEMLRRLQPILERLAANPVKGFADAVREFFDIARQNATMSRLFVGEALERKRRLRYEFTSRDPGFQALPHFLQLIQRGRATGQLSDRADTLLALLIAAMFCIVYPLTADRLAPLYKILGVRDADAFTREQLVNIVLYGIAGPKARPEGDGRAPTARITTEEVSEPGNSEGVMR